MPGDESQDRPQSEEVPKASPVKTSHQPREPGELDGLPHGKAGEHRQYPQNNGGRVSLFLQRIVGFMLYGLGAKEKIMPDHGPDAGKIFPSEQNLPVIAAEDLEANINQAGAEIDPHKREVPLQGSAQPAAQRQRLGPIDQIVFRNL